MADFSIKAFDRLPFIRVTLKTGTGPTAAPVNLSTAQKVDFIMKPATGNNVQVKVNTAAVIVDAASGIVRYEWASGDTNVPGQYLGEWEVTWDDGRTQTFPTKSYVSIEVLADLDSAA